MSDNPELPTPEKIREIARHLTPAQLKDLESLISETFAKAKHARYLSLLRQADAAAKNQTVQTTNYLARACPRCGGYVDVMMRRPDRDLPVRGVNGRCLKCSYRLAWIVVTGGRKAVKIRRKLRGNHVPPQGFL